MSYARSPLLVCSITMGTSIFCGSLTCPHFFPNGQRGENGMHAALCRPAVQRIQGLLVADAMPNSIQPCIPRQTRAHLLYGLLRLVGQHLQLAVNLLITDLNLFCVSNLLEDQRRLNLAQCSLALTGTQTAEVHALHVFGFHALRSQSTQPALQPEVNLLIQHYLGNREVVALHQLFHNLIFAPVFGFMRFLRLHALAQAIAKLIQRGEFGAQLLGEVVVQLRHAAALDSFDIHLVGHRFARQPLVGEVVRILHFEAPLLACLGATQVPGELRNRVFTTDLDHHLVHFHRLGVGLAILWRAVETDHGEVPIRQRALLFYRAICRLPLAQVVEGALDLFLGNLRRQFLNADVVVGCDFELRQYLEDRLERQRLTLMQVKIGHARLRHRLQVLLLCLLAEIARHQGFDNLALDLIGEALADDGSRDLALAKARNARLLLIAEQDGVSLCADYISRDRNRYFAFARIRWLLGLDVCRVGRACRAGFSRQENAFRSGCGRAQKYNRR